jgi:hypothetical protein
LDGVNLWKTVTLLLHIVRWPLFRLSISIEVSIVYWQTLYLQIQDKLALLQDKQALIQDKQALIIEEASMPLTSPEYV